MNKLKIAAVGAAGAGAVSREDWLFILSILLTVLGMVQDYLKNKKP